MKRLWGILIFLLVPAFSFAATIDCSRVEAIVITKKNFDQNDGIQANLTNYKNHASPDGSAYWLCFKFIENPNTSIPNLTLNTSSSDKPVFVSGLQLKNNTGPLVLKGSKAITLLNSSFTGCPNCLWVDGTGHTVENVQVDCSDKSKEGIGIKLTGQGHKVLQTSIQQCKTGLQIGDSVRPGNQMHVGPDTPDAAQKVTAFKNGTAFKLVYGWGNFFKYNSVYENDANGDGIFAGEEGIFFEEAVNNDMVMPILINSKDDIYTGQADESVLRYKAACDPNKKDWSADAVIKVKFPYNQGLLELDRTFSEDSTGQIKDQGKTYYSNANCLFESQRDSIFQYTAQCTIPMNNNVMNKWVVALFHHPTFGSSTYSFSFRLNGPCGFGILSAADQGAAGAGGVEIATAGGILSEPALPSSDSEDESDKGGNSIGASTPSGDTAGSVLTSGIAATGAPGGVGGCGGGGASLYPVGGFSAPWIINLLVAFGFLIPARIRRK